MCPILFNGARFTLLTQASLCAFHIVDVIPCMFLLHVITRITLLLSRFAKKCCPCITCIKHQGKKKARGDIGILNNAS